MLLELEINDRQYNDISSFCEANNLQVQDYIMSLITEKHSLNKFGDLNNLIPKAIDESTVVVKKRGRPKKNSVSTETTQDIRNEKLAIGIKENDSTETAKPIQNEETANHKAVVKRKRTLKTI